MKFTAAAVLSAAAGVSATYGYVAPGNTTAAPTGTGSVVYTTEVVTALTTYCPEATQITHGDKTYTITSATTLTITDCPCTVVKPVIPTSSVVCHNCYNNNTSPTSHGAPAPAPAPSKGPAGSSAPTVPTAGAGKAAALTGAGLAGIVGLAAFLL
jgi:hypothetical protein